MTASPSQAATARDREKRLPSLDGLRGISIAFVLLGHAGGTAGLRPVNLGVGDYAHLGVVVFFVISGFLITRLLIDEHARRGRISLSLFYICRSLRLCPAAYAYIAVVTNAFPQNVIFAVLAALASYYLLEQPFLKLRQRLRPSHAQPGARSAEA